ncbi:MAG: helix-turn-helix transcriptional regulator [Ruminococcaceae bacterium]|nr:helix-turn-helix transcriptional regulator [Oscillospiraceae bacterium]
MIRLSLKEPLENTLLTDRKTRKPQIDFLRFFAKQMTDLKRKSEHSLFMVKTKIILFAIMLLEVNPMNLIQIGKFIAQLRKERGQSQEQLGEILGVTNKTVSRWETGTYLPPVEMLLSMSHLFAVSINELLSGKRLNPNEHKAAKDNLKPIVKASSFSRKEKMMYYKKKWLKEHITAMCCWGIGIITVLVIGIIATLPLLIVAAMLLLLVGHAWRNNTMMAYVERKIFESTEKND